MKNFIPALPSIIRRCRRAKGVLLLFDFDGTLAPIVDHPADARMTDEWRTRLKKLHRLPHVTVGIVTGRALEDIRSLVRIPGMLFAASHGFDIAKGSKMLMSYGREDRKHFMKLALDLDEALRKFDGVIVEDKGTAATVHYRMAQKDDRIHIMRLTRTIAAPWLDKHGWQLTGGKMIMEVRPATRWNKGSAVEWIGKHLAPKYLPCYIGDDVTDEDAFRIIGNKGITVRIGRSSRSHARYFVRNVDQLIPWFDELMEFRV